MRAIYAISFDVGDASIAEALPIVGEWFSRGEPDEALATNLEPGQRSYELPEGRGALEVEVIEVDGTLMWTGTRRELHVDEPSIALLSEVTLADINGVLSFGLTIQAERVGEELTPIRFPFAPPRLPRTLIDRFSVWDGETRLSSGPTAVGHADVERFIQRVLCASARQRPVVFISADDRGTRPPISPEEIAHDLCGLAHVHHSLYSLPDRALSRQLGKLGCYGGAVRIYWPGFNLASDPYEHPLYTPARLRNWQGRPFREALRGRLYAIAASTMASPPQFRELRRAARRQQLKERDIPDSQLDEFERWLSETEDDRDKWKSHAEELERRLDDALDENRALKASFRQVGQAASVATAEAETVGARAEEPPKTALQAVEQAEALCPHLVFLKAAFESAEDCPYKRPSDVLEKLLLLEQLATAEAQPDGIGKSLAEAAEELGLQWRGGISQTAATRYTRHYVRQWDGREIMLGPHVCLGSGSGAGNIARIYLYRDEADEPEDRRYVIGHVGRKLPDTTT